MRHVKNRPYWSTIGSTWFCPSGCSLILACTAVCVADWRRVISIPGRIEVITSSLRMLRLVKTLKHLLCKLQYWSPWLGQNILVTVWIGQDPHRWLLEITWFLVVHPSFFTLLLLLRHRPRTVLRSDQYAAFRNASFKAYFIKLFGLKFFLP